MSVSFLRIENRLINLATVHSIWQKGHPSLKDVAELHAWRPTPEDQDENQLLAQGTVRQMGYLLDAITEQLERDAYVIDVGKIMATIPAQLHVLFRERGGSGRILEQGGQPVDEVGKIIARLQQLLGPGTQHKAIDVLVVSENGREYRLGLVSRTRVAKRLPQVTDNTTVREMTKVLRRALSVAFDVEEDLDDTDNDDEDDADERPRKSSKKYRTDDEDDEY